MFMKIGLRATGIHIINSRSKVNMRYNARQKEFKKDLLKLLALL
jgi:hypothetical protein